MTTVAEIQKAIKDLPKADYARLKRWVDEYDWGAVGQADRSGFR